MLDCSELKREFDQHEAEAMRLAGDLGLTNDDVDALNLVARIVHQSYADTRGARSSTYVSASDARMLTEWLRRIR